MLSCGMSQHLNGKVALSLLILIRVVIVLDRGLKLVDIDVEDSVPTRRTGPSRKGAVTLNLVLAGVLLLMLGISALSAASRLRIQKVCLIDVVASFSVLFGLRANLALRMLRLTLVTLAAVGLARSDLMNDGSVICRGPLRPR